MNMNISHSTYKNKASLVLSNACLRVEFLPEPGGKMVSLKDLRSGYEYLVQREGKTYRDQPFAGNYVEGECSGYDDMFPTIDACDYQEQPWKGTPMSDHGEVWSLPWASEISSDSLKLTVKGIRFPYILQKEISFVSDDILHFRYQLLNTGEHDLEFLWAGHFMINIEPGTRVEVPGDCRKAVSILSNSNRTYGEVMDWPVFSDAQGNDYHADVVRPAESRGFEKYYFRDKLRDGWCRLVYPDKKKQLTISFSADTVPYLGLLMNENGWGDLYNIFIEPCTVCYDRPDIAKAYGQVSKVGAGGNYYWDIYLTIK